MLAVRDPTACWAARRLEYETFVRSCGAVAALSIDLLTFLTSRHRASRNFDSDGFDFLVVGTVSRVNNQYRVLRAGVELASRAE